MITLSFEKDSASLGSAGCNTYNGQYQLQAASWLRRTDHHPTDVQDATRCHGAGDCLSLPAPECTTYQLQANNLRMFDAGGKLVLEFELPIEPR